MTARPQAQCGACERMRSPLSPENVAGLRRPFCAAFPAGIPDDIWQNEVDHRKPIVGDHDLQWIPRDGAAFPTYAFAPGVLDTGPMVSMTAAGNEAPTGAMIALVPRDEDAARLAVEGGEAQGELHCTLVYLGDAVDIDQDVRDDLAAWAREIAKQWSSVEADAFAPALFNPDGEEPCAVLVLSGNDLDEFHQTALADVSELYDLPEQHQPWIPHLTLVYMQPAPGQIPPVPNSRGIEKRTGQVVFDRIRLAYAGEITDIPLGDIVAPQPVDESVEESPVVASAREEWDGCPRGFHAAHTGACPPAL